MINQIRIAVLSVASIYFKNSFLFFKVYEPLLRPQLHHAEVERQRRHKGRTLRHQGHRAWHGVVVQLPVRERWRGQETVPLRSSKLLR